MPQTYVFDSTEFTVNTTTANTQNRGTVSPMAGGGYVVVWTDAANNDDVKAQIYNAAGIPISGELTVATGAATQTSRDVLGTADGGFVVAWIEAQEIRLQRFNGGGTPVGSQIVVAPAPSGLHFHNDVELHSEPGGGFTVVWQTEEEGIRIRSYEADGDPIGTTFELLATDPQEIPNDPAFLRLPGGGFALAFWREDQGSVSPEQPFTVPYTELNIYNAAGVLVSSSAIAEPVFSPQLVALAGGGFVMVYDHFDAHEGIEAQRYDNSGNPVGGPITVIANPLVGFDAQQVVALPGGGFLVTWAGGDTSDIQGQVFAADGSAVGARFLFNEVTAGSQTLPSIAVRDDGDIVIVWQDGSTTDIKARLMTPATGSLPVTNGTPGPDTINGGSGSEAINGLGGDDFIHGNGGDDTITGGDGVDVLFGDGGFDELSGGAGDDFLFVDFYDQVHEAAGEGYDNVLASGDYMLSAGARVEVLSTDNHAGTAIIGLRGNEFGQVVIGNAGSNWIDGGGGVDRLDGFGGSDTYYTDGDDVIIETGTSSSEVDSVIASADYRLTPGSYVEFLSADGTIYTYQLDLIGNERDQTITGNDGKNGLDGGGGGADILVGNGGDDFFWVDSDDVVSEALNDGYDNVLARTDYTLQSIHVEVLSTDNHSGTAPIDLTGNAVRQIIIGNAGNNILNGMGGDDQLAGLGGADSYAFTTALGSGNIDLIDGFDADDTILLDNAVFQGLVDGALPASAFVTGTAAADADDRIIYDAATGRLFFDADGNGVGAQIQFATLLNNFALSASDFTVI